MAPDPTHRYPTVEALAEEIERWLADLPVAAHPDPWSRRLARWARRHRTAVVSLVLIASASTLGVTQALSNASARAATAARQRERLLNAASDAQSLAKAEAWSDRLTSAVRIFRSSALNLAAGGESSLSAQARAQADALNRIVAFDRLADDGERLACHVDFAAATQAWADALAELGIDAYRDWWKSLPATDWLNPARLSQLRGDAYRLMLLRGWFMSLSEQTGPDDDPSASSETGRMIQAAVHYKPEDSSGRLLAWIVAGQDTPPPETKPVSGADHYLLGLIHLVLAEAVLDPFVPASLASAKLFPGLHASDHRTVAGDYLRQAAVLEGKHYWSHFWRGQLLKKSQHFDQAVSEFNTCIGLRDNLADAYVARGEALLAQVDSQPKAARNTARSASDTFDFARLAMLDYEHAVRLSPGDIDARTAMLTLLVYFNGGKKALDEAGRVYDLAPDRWTALHWTVTEPSEPVQETRRWVEQVANQDRGDAIAWSVLAAGFLATGEPSEAQWAASQALRSDPGNSRALIIRGTLRLSQGQVEQSLHDFRNAASQDPQSWRAAIGAARAEVALKQYERATEDLTLARQVAVNRWQTWETKRERADLLRMLDLHNDGRADSSARSPWLDEIDIAEPATDAALMAATDGLPSMPWGRGIVEVIGALRHERNREPGPAQEAAERALIADPDNRLARVLLQRLSTVEQSNN